MNVGAWLRELGLGQYEAAFRDNDSSSQPDGGDLKDLGVSIVGHRRKPLDAIAGLHAGQTRISIRVGHCWTM
jgi:hypothetical protein